MKSNLENNYFSFKNNIALLKGQQEVRQKWVASQVGGGSEDFTATPKISCVCVIVVEASKILVYLQTPGN